MQLFSFIQKFYFFAIVTRFLMQMQNLCGSISPDYLHLLGSISSLVFFKLKCTLRDKISSGAMAYVQTKLDLVKKCSWSLFFVRVFTVSAKLWQKAFCKGSLLCWRVWGSELCGDLLDGSVLGFRDLEENVDDE